MLPTFFRPQQPPRSPRLAGTRDKLKSLFHIGHHHHHAGLHHERSWASSTSEADHEGEQQPQRRASEEASAARERAGRSPEERLEELFQHECVVGIHLKGDLKRHRDALQGKYMEADGETALMLMSPEQRDRFAKYPSVVALDVCQAAAADGGGTRARHHSVVTGLALDCRGEATTLFHCVVDLVTPRNFASALRRLVDINPEPAKAVRFLCLFRFEASLAAGVHRDLEQILGRPVGLIPDAACFQGAVEQAVADPRILGFIKVRHPNTLPSYSTTSPHFFFHRSLSSARPRTTSTGC